MWLATGKVPSIWGHKMAKMSSVLLLFLIIASNERLTSSISAAENKLADFLLNATRYSPAVRPVANYNDLVTVQHGLNLAQLIKLDERSQIVTTSVLLKMRWYDMLLKWDPAKYDGITEFSVDVSLIWIPQIELFNNADDSLDQVAVPRATVRYDGSVKAVFPKILKSTCEIKVKDFPFDQQMCQLRFGSFQFDTMHMDLQPISSKVILDGYQKNGEWDLQKTKAVRGSVFHAFSNTSEFTEMSYKLLLRRKPLYYVANFLIPCVLIALITILLFLIPADTGEQMAVGVTILLSLAVFFLLLEEKMPETSDAVPLIGKYFACTIVEASLAVGAICMVLCFHHHDGTEVPVWMKKYILVKLATLLRIKTSENEQQSRSRRGTKLYRFKKSSRSSRRTDDFAVEVARKNLLIWQAKAKAKRLRREKASKEAFSNETLLTNLSEEDLRSKELDETTTKPVKERKHEDKIEERKKKERKERHEKDAGTKTDKKTLRDKKKKARDEKGETEKEKTGIKKESGTKEKGERQEKTNERGKAKSGTEKDIDGKKEVKEEHEKESKKSKEKKGEKRKSERGKTKETDIAKIDKKGESDKDGMNLREKKVEGDQGKKNKWDHEQKSEGDKEKKDKGNQRRKITRDQEKKEESEKKSMTQKEAVQKQTNVKKEDPSNDDDKKKGSNEASKSQKVETWAKLDNSEDNKQKRNEDKNGVKDGKKVGKNQQRSKKADEEETKSTRVEKNKGQIKENREVAANLRKVEKPKKKIKEVDFKDNEAFVKEADTKLIELGSDGDQSDFDIPETESLKGLGSGQASDRRKTNMGMKANGIAADTGKMARLDVSSDAGSTESMRSCDDDTKILIPSPRLSRSVATGAYLGKQFRLVDRVVRMKDSLRNRLNRPKSSSAPKLTPQPTASQVTAKKLENAADWEEAEHESVKLMANTIQETETADQLKGKWKEVGRVINYFMMWLYIIALIFTFFALFLPVLVADEIPI